MAGYVLSVIVKPVVSWLLELALNFRAVCTSLVQRKQAYVANLLKNKSAKVGMRFALSISIKDIC
jgi:hypothetical protein